MRHNIRRKNEYFQKLRIALIIKEKDNFGGTWNKKSRSLCPLAKYSGGAPSGIALLVMDFIYLKDVMKNTS